MENWITTSHFGTKAEQKPELVTNSEIGSPKSQNQISELKLQLQQLQTTYAVAEERNCKAAAAAQLQIQELQQKNALLQTQNTAAEDQIRQAAEVHKGQLKDHQIKHELLQAQHNTAIQQHQQMVAEEKQKSQKQTETLRTYLGNRRELAAMATQKLHQIRHTVAEVRQEATGKLREFQQEIEGYKARIPKLAITSATHENPQRIQELAKIEVFDLWLQERSNSGTETQFSVHTLLQRVTAKISHTLKTLKTELHQATTEREDLQGRLEQHEEEASGHLKWDKLLDFNKIEDPGNLITATMKNLPPPISIYQYYQAYKPIIFKGSNLPDLKFQIHLSKPQFQILWAQADSAARDLLVFMWILKDIITSKGTVEVTTADPAFYATRFCTRALIHISQHHTQFYSNIANRNSLPQIEPYDINTTREVQEIVNQNFPEFLSAIDTLAQEDTTQLHEAALHHQNLMKKYPKSFSITFHKIQLHGYVTRALEERKYTLEQRQITTPHPRTLLYLPQYDPGSMKIAKRS